MTPQNIKDKIVELEETKAKINNQLHKLYGLDYLEWLKNNKEDVTVYYHYGCFVLPYYKGHPWLSGGLLYIEDTVLYYDVDTEEWTCYATNSAIDDFVKFGLKIEFGGSWNASELEKHYKKRLNENLGGL